VNERLVALRDLAKRVSPKVGYPLLYVFLLVLFCSWTFPYGKLKDKVTRGFNAQQRASGSREELDIEDMGSSFITGVKMKGVRLTAPSAEPGKSASETKIDEVTARISLLPLLIGNRDISFHAKAFGGSLDGTFDDHGEKEKDFSAKIDTMDLSQLTPLVEAVGLPMEGTLTGTVKIEMPEGKASKASGSVSLETDGLAVGDGKAKLKGALALPRVNVGALAFVGDVKDGVLKVTKFGASGKDVELIGDGRIQLREVATESNCDMNVRFKINDAYRTNSDVTKSLFGAPGSTAPALFELADARVKQSKRGDGFYGWRVRGMLAHLDFVPNASGGGPSPSLPGGFTGRPTPGAGAGNHAAPSAAPAGEPAPGSSGP
jgi:type II secretion system protein N